MPAALALGSPFVVAALAAVARRRIGAWASWLFLLGCAYLLVRFGVHDVWWNEPGFLASLDEALGAICAVLVMALSLHAFGRVRPSLPTQIGAVGSAALAVQWAYASAPPDLRNSPLIPVVLGVCLLGLVTRDVRRWLLGRRAPARSASEA